MSRVSGFQLSLPLVKYEIQAEVIHQRISDGYVNATAMCKAGGKLFNDYSRLKLTPPFLDVLARSTGIPVDVLIVTVMTGQNEMRGTWVHPQVAINLAQWISPEFAVKVTQWVFDWMSGKVPGGNLPYHLRRYMANMTKVPNGHFSMLNEMTVALIAPLEQLGYKLPDRMVPDISEGKMFSKWLRENGHDTSCMPSYQHEYEDGRVVPARAYPVIVLPDFRRHFVETWLGTKAIEYFADRDPAAIPYLEKLLSLPSYSDISGFLPKKH
jgi:hypothetical protein